MLKASGLLIIFLISASGWGRLVFSRLNLPRSRSIAYEAALGLTVWIILGGILNLAGSVTPLSLDIMLGAGIIMAVYFGIKRTVNLIKTREFNIVAGLIKISNTGVPLIPLMAVTVFCALYALPVSAFNLHDDYYKYLPRIFRMLQSGSVGGTPFDLIGLDSFGAQAFLQGFFMAHLDVVYANAFDLICCFFLGGLLVNDIGRKAGVNWIFRTMTLVIYIVIDPLYVNISTLYAGSLMVLGIIYSSLLFTDVLDTPGSRNLLQPLLPVMFFYFSFIVLKLTLAPFAVIYIILFFLMIVALAANERKAHAYAISGSAAITAFLFSPWFLASLDKVSFFYKRFVHKSNQLIAMQETPNADFSLGEFLLSTINLPNGSTVFAYNFIVFCILLITLLALYSMWKAKDRVARFRLIIITAAGLSTLATFLVNYYFARIPSVGIRYTCPILIGVLPAIISLISRRKSPVEGTGMFAAGVQRILKPAVVLLMCFAVISLHIRATAARMRQLKVKRTMLVFPVGDDYLAYNRNSLSKLQLNLVRSMQMRTVPGKTIIAWFDTPFHLDFTRNRVLTVASIGMIKSNVPADERFDDGPEGLREYFKSYGIQYV